MVHIISKSLHLFGETEKNQESPFMRAAVLTEFSTTTFGKARTMAAPATSATVGDVAPTPIHLQTNSPGHHKCPLPHYNQKYLHATPAFLF